MGTDHFVYASLTDHSYLMPVTVMLTSLLAQAPKHPIIVFCFDDVSEMDRLQLEALDPRISVQSVIPVPLPSNVQIAHPEWCLAFARIQFFGLEQYDRILALDADMVVLDDLDPLFELDPPVGCSHNYPLSPTTSGFNGGLLLLRPDRELLRYMLKEILPLASPYPPHCWSTSEQELIAALFSDEPMARQWRQLHGITPAGTMQFLDYRYNAITGLRESQDPTWNVNDAKVLHYTCGPKPWRPIATATPWNQIWAYWYERAFPDKPPPLEATWMHKV